MRRRSRHAFLSGCLLWQQGCRTFAIGVRTPVRGISSLKTAFYYNDVFQVTLPDNHRFPMAKYRMVRQTLQKDFADNYSVAFLESPMATETELASTHCPNYIRRYLNGDLSPLEVRRTGFPWSIEHVRRSTSSVGGTVAAMRTLLSNRNLLFTGHIAGGTHHAFYDYGEGFCIFSDIAVATNLALKEYSDLVKKVAIIDLDVHQGNGNAELFRDRKDVFTFSMQCKGNYFSQRRQSSVDVDLEVDCDDDTYLRELSSWLPYILDIHQPQLVFYQAGVDIFQNDKLGKLKITRQGLRKRNQMVFDSLAQHRIPCVVTMGGGYPRNLNPTSREFQELVECHADVYRQCASTALAAT